MNIFSSFPTIATSLLNKIPKTLCDQFHKRLDNNFDFQALLLDSASENALLIIAEYINVVIESFIALQTNNQENYKKWNQNLLISFIKASLKMEGTWPGETSGDEITKKLETLISDGAQSSSNVSNKRTFHVDGDKNNGEQCDLQLKQHIRAYQYLCSTSNLNFDTPLSVDLLHKTHALLLENSVDTSNNLIPAGKFRTISLFASTTCANAPPHIYPMSELVPELIKAAVDRYNSRRSNRTGIFASPLALASSLFFEIVDIHPYVNGNGRLARLLFAYSLMRDGLPFPVALQCGTDTARNFYLEAIERVRYSRSLSKSKAESARADHPEKNQTFKITCENYKPECLDYLVQLGLFSMYSIAHNIEYSLVKINDLSETTTQHTETQQTAPDV